MDWQAVISHDLVDQSVCCSLPSKGRWLNICQDWEPSEWGWPEISHMVKFNCESSKQEVINHYT